MPDSRAMKAEPVVQPRFRLPTLFLGGLIAALVLFAHDHFMALPDRVASGPGEVTLRQSPAQLDPAGFRPLRLAGAWVLESDDPRFGGISAAALDGPDFVAITDYGVMIRFPRPAGATVTAQIRGLAEGPASGAFKKNRDSEALARDPLGRGWWVAFEHANQLWLYDRQFARALARVRIPRAETRYNWGVEGLAVVGDSLLALPESGGLLLRFGPSGWSEARLDFPASRASDLAVLSPSSLLMIERETRLLGFSNALVRMDRCASGYCLAWRKRLPLGVRDNVEALAVEPGPSGGTRLWLMTDNNGQRRIRTLLIALDLPAGL